MQDPVGTLNDTDNVRYTLISKNLHRRPDLKDILEIPRRDVQARDVVKNALAASENLQMHSTPHANKKLMYKIVAKTPYTFQIDVMFMPKSLMRDNDGIMYLLIMVDVASRMMFASPMKDNTAKELLTAYDHILRLLHQKGVTPSAVTGDLQFRGKFQAYNESKNIAVYLVNAAEDDVTRGNRLGIINRAIRTLRGMFDKWMTVKGTRWMDGAPEVMMHYNTHPHRALKLSKDDDDRSPADVFFDVQREDGFYETQRKLLLKKNNETLARSKLEANNLEPGNTVRILTKKGLFDKAGINFTRGTCTVSGRHLTGVPGGWSKGYRFAIDACDEDALNAERNNESFKRWEMFKVDPASPLVRVNRQNIASLAERTADERSRRRLEQAGLDPNLLDNIVPSTRRNWDVITAWEDLLPPADGNAPITVEKFDRRLAWLRAHARGQARLPSNRVPTRNMAVAGPPQTSFFAAVATSVLAAPLGLVPATQQTAIEYVESRILEHMHFRYNTPRAIETMANGFAGEPAAISARPEWTEVIDNSRAVKRAIQTLRGRAPTRNINYINAKEGLLKGVAERVRSADGAPATMKKLIAEALKIDIIVVDVNGSRLPRIRSGDRASPDVFVRQTGVDTFVGMAGNPIA